MELDMDDYVKSAYESAVSEINILPWENEIQSQRRQISYLNIRFLCRHC